MIYTNEHYIRLKHVQLYERIYQIFFDHPLNDSNSSLKSTCCCVFTTSNKPTTVFWLLLGGNLQKKTRHQTLAPWSIKTSFLWHRPKFRWGSSFCQKKRKEKKSKTWKTNLFCTRVWVLPKKGRLLSTTKMTHKNCTSRALGAASNLGICFRLGPRPRDRKVPPWKLTGIPWKLMVGRCNFRD